MADIAGRIAEELGIRKEQVENTVKLLDEGNTLPFIARYRKEVTGSLDDTILRNLEDRLNDLRKLEERKQEVISLISAQDKMTEEIGTAIERAETLNEIEDIYRPFRPKRKTRASVAREKGLEPLAALITEQPDSYEEDLEKLAERYVKPDGAADAAEAIDGACDIIAEDISDNAEFRKKIREFVYEYGVLVSKKAKDEDSVYSIYYDFREKIKTLPKYRVLAINRGEKEEYLKVDLEMPEEIILNYLSYEIITNQGSPARPYLIRSLTDAYERLIAPSVEREIRAMIFEEASEGAIAVFAANLTHLLMQSPLKGFTVIGYDPGYRTGCKLAVVDPTGLVLDTAVIYPTKPREDIEGSRKTLLSLIKRYAVNVIAIGNGTASKESEIFVTDTIRGMDDVKYIMVSEAGASVYSASKLAAEEFPDFDVTQRSAVSIARRLQDPLAELVKIDPKSIGVGQYQHDMKQARLDEALFGVVEDCVNSVGVDLNTASQSLLSYISGINTSIAKNIIKYRETNGAFASREELRKVPRLGDKAYEQCAGFVRIHGADEVLDNTAVHPESYKVAKSLLEKLGYTEEDVKNRALKEMRTRVKKSGFDNLCRDLGVGAPTLNDILDELEKPGRDPRDVLPKPVLRMDIMSINDLKPDMMLTGTVRNVIDFGAFVDIGVHQDGLVHISEMSDRFVKHPSEILSVGDVVNVRVKSVDVARSRIALSLLPAGR